MKDKNILSNRKNKLKKQEHHLKARRKGNEARLESKEREEGKKNAFYESHVQ